MFICLNDQELVRHVCKKPGNEVKIGKWVDEIRLPDLTLNDREHTIALDWRQLLSRLFAEERKKIRCEGDGGAIYHYVRRVRRRRDAFQPSLRTHMMDSRRCNCPHISRYHIPLEVKISARSGCLFCFVRGSSSVTV